MDGEIWPTSILILYRLLKGDLDTELVHKILMARHSYRLPDDGSFMSSSLKYECICLASADTWHCAEAMGLNGTREREVLIH